MEALDAHSHGLQQHTLICCNRIGIALGWRMQERHRFRALAHRPQCGCPSALGGAPAQASHGTGAGGTGVLPARAAVGRRRAPPRPGLRAAGAVLRRSWAGPGGAGGAAGAAAGARGGGERGTWVPRAPDSRPCAHMRLRLCQHRPARAAATFHGLALAPASTQHVAARAASLLAVSTPRSSPCANHWEAVCTCARLQTTRACHQQQLRKP